MTDEVSRLASSLRSTSSHDLLVHVKDILRTFVQIMFAAGSGRKEHGVHSLGTASSLCCDLLKRLCLEPDICGPLMCTDELFDLLCRPIKQYLATKRSFNDYLKSNLNSFSESSLISLADLFAAMASNDVGYQYLLRTPPAMSSSVSHQLLVNPLICSSL